MNGMGRPASGPASRILRSERTVVSPWVTVVARTVDFGDGREPEVYHSLEQADYVSVVGLTASGHVPLVRQYRPAVDEESLELPGGLLDPDEDPADAARRETAEETGYAPRTLLPLGCYHPDPGRLGNRIWGYLAPDLEPVPGWSPERGVSLELVPAADLAREVAAGRFRNLLHAGLIAVAMAQGRFPAGRPDGG
jgi:ADP-ribose pyrophosphatase